MEFLLGEHGENLIYGIIGTIMVILVCTICANKWKDISPEYKTKVHKSNGDFILGNTGRYPVINADEIIYTNYKSDKFDIYDHIQAKDYTGKDITDNIHVYGTVNTFQQGIYKLRCVVVDDNQLACTKYVNVIVE